MNGLLHDMAWVEGVRSVYLTPLFEFLTGLGGTVFLLLFLVLGFLMMNRTIFGRAIAIVLVSTIIGQWLKHYFQDPRPPAALALDPTVEGTFGFPSGHSQVAVALWLWLAYHVRQRWGALLLVAVAAGVVFSRLYLGVHDFEDVAGGMSIGFVILLVFIGWASDRFSEIRERYAVVPLAAAVSLTLVSVATWPGADPRPAMVLGSLLCALWFADRLEGRGVYPERADSGKYLWLGVAGGLAVVALLAGLSQALPMQAVPVILVTGIYAGALAPTLMARLRLLRGGKGQGEESSL